MKSKINYEELNPAQLEAVQSTEGPHLVIAGAGSGKTRVLVYRVACLVENGIKPGRILILTFTRKAAQEMLSRASELLDKSLNSVAGGTFHSFANAVLRKYAPLLDLPRNFTILDQDDSENIVNIVRKDLGFAKGDKRFPKKRALFNLISKSVNKRLDMELVIDEEYPHFLEYANEIKKIKDGYIKYKKEKALLDYDDLLIYLKTLLSTHKDVRSVLSNKYRYIMVDEYQDTNKLQAEILYLLLSEHKNIMVVGDDSQSIYSFRGANFKNIMDFPRVFKGAKVITLEENYRSAQPILNLTNEVIEYASEKFDKRLFSTKKGNRLPIFVDAENENAQSKYIVEKVGELASNGVHLRDIAILFRAGWHSNDLEIELARNNIPFLKYGGQKFIESAHIKDLISHVRILHNRFDEVSWRRVLMLVPGIGAKTVERLVKSVSDKKGLPFDDKIIKKTHDLNKLDKFLKGMDAKKELPAAIIKAFNEYYQPILREKYDDFHKRANDLESLERIASRYGHVEEFLTDMALEPPDKSIIGAGMHEKKKNSLVLSTVHSAKGLEWHTVFIIYVAEGHIPYYQAFGNEDSIEEERRLLYVAMTRAKENLFMLKPIMERSRQNYITKGGAAFTQISRFLNEGDILRKYIDIDNAQHIDYFNDIEPDFDDFL